MMGQQVTSNLIRKMRKGTPNVAGEKVDLDVLLMLLLTGYQIKTTEFSKSVCFPMNLNLL